MSGGGLRRPGERSDGSAWALTAAALANTALLIVARAGPSSGPYGGVGVVFLVAHFVVCGVLAGAAARAVRWPVAVAVGLGVAVGVAVAASWAATPAGVPLLPLLLPWAAGARVAWAATARRVPAVVAAAGLCCLWVLGVARRLSVPGAKSVAR